MPVKTADTGGEKLNRDEVKEKLVALLATRFHMDKDLLVRENHDALLTGDLFRMDDIAMVYLFCETEKCFGLRFPREMLEGYGFSTINGIADGIVTVGRLNHEYVGN